ncbi:hypothetical protein Ahy_A01g000406 [Arachis hypogaea]|uniref:MULE transposase domain-containing protein n=1 Tax=Arachis hypogaea TaxID=3818 RepID=A0A445EK69_ARAHY|nr:hypothetical protein Ahy_A01g000406 [Arachis hypogaea]
MHVKCVIEVNDEADIQSNKTFLALANEVGGPSNLDFSEKDVRNCISSRLQSTYVNVDVKEMLNYFMRMKELNLNFFYAVNVNDDYKFTSAVWVDARCRASYEYYGDVVSFDTTYSTNRHGLSFAVFIGVNHHGKSTLLGCALLDSEKIPSFEWVFTQWLQCMGIAPQGIITNQGKSVFDAIKKVLPNTRHLWCIWHITKKIQNKLGDLFEERHMWVPIFFRGQFWASMRSTQRSKGTHSFFGGFLNCKTSLVQFIHEFDNVLRTKKQKELEDDIADSREFGKKADCSICAVYKQGDSAWDFVDCDDEVDILHTALDDVRAKQVDYRGRMRNKTVANAHNSIATKTSSVVDTEDIRGPSKVTTKSRPKGKRLGYELDKSIRKSMQRKRKSSCKNLVGNINLDAPALQIAQQGVGGFMSLLNSFNNT